MRARPSRLWPLACAVMLPAAAGTAATRRVPGEYPTIQAALDAAQDGDTVLVAPGRYEVETPLSFKGPKGVRAKLTLVSEAGAELTTIASTSGKGVARFVSRESRDNVLEGFTLTTTVTPPQELNGGAIHCFQSTPQVKGCRIVGNVAENGGGIYSLAGSPTFIECRIEGNSARKGGGICLDQSPARFVDCVINENRSTRDDLGAGGGGVFSVASSATFTSCSITRNLAARGGGIAAEGAATLTLEDCAILDNLGFAEGGALFTSMVTTRATHCTISGNWSAWRPAVQSWGGRWTVDSSIIWDNAGGSLLLDQAPLTAIRSCIEGLVVQPGSGNIDADPSFCGWGQLDLAHVNAGSAGPGDGSAERPFPTLAPALSYDYRLSADSPCIGSGSAGGDMGAALGVCAEGNPKRSRRIVLAPGAYAVPSLSTLLHHVSLEGGGADRTRVEGSLFGLRTGEFLSGFEVTLGTQGGVVVGRGDDPHIRDLRITGNTAGYPGGAVALFGSSGKTTACAIVGNQGTGVYAQEGSPEIEGCVISENSGIGLYFSYPGAAAVKDSQVTMNRGGGLFSYESSPRLSGCTLSGNSGSEFGGVDCRYGKPEFLGCRIAGNRGHGMRLTNGCEATFVDCEIVDNRMALWIEYASAVLSGCTVTGNSGPIRLIGSTARLDHSTVAGNFSPDDGALHLTGSQASLESCVVWGNAGPPFLLLHNSSREVARSCLEERAPPPGAGNIIANPLFCGWSGAAETAVASQADFDRVLSGFSVALSAASPCRGAGENGTDMGSRTRACDSPGGPVQVTLAEGVYRTDDRPFPHPLSIEGTGAGSVLEGGIYGLRTGERLARLKVHGGVVVAPGEAPRLEECVITANDGVRCARESAPVLEKCVLSGNGTTALVAEEDSRPVLVSCTISGNRGNPAGGIYLRGASPVIEDCSITDNEGWAPSGFAAGGVWCESGSRGSFKRCRIARNQRGVVCAVSSTLFEDCSIVENRTAGVVTSAGEPVFRRCDISFNRGQGLSTLFGAPRFENCLLYGNSGRAFPVHFNRSGAVVNHCTISGNVADEGPGVLIESEVGDQTLQLADCIIWANLTGPLLFRGTGPRPAVAFSCIEGSPLWPGPGNLNQDPLFCGWGPREEVHVDAARPGPGDGSAQDPYPTIASALAYHCALAAGSPCLGAASGGGDMGADQGRCQSAGAPRRRIRVAAGAYPLEGGTLTHQVSMEGLGAAQTVLQGTVRGLRSGASLRDLAVQGGEEGGIVVTGREAPEIVRVRVSQGAPGIMVLNASPSIRDCEITLNKVGLRLLDSSGEVLDTTIARNVGVAGAGIEVYRSSTVVRGCLIAHNEASNVGGGLYHVVGESFRLERCVLVGNRALTGGGVYTTALTLSSCLVLANRAQRGGGVNLEEGSLTLSSCTVSGNRADVGGGVLVPSRIGSSARISSSILWGNSPDSLEGIAEVSHSLVDATLPWPGPGNLIGDAGFRAQGKFDFERTTAAEILGSPQLLPDFVVEAGDYRLGPGAPGIDAGAPGDAGGLDLDGNPRQCGAAVDLGAYERCAPDFRRAEVNGDDSRDTSDVVVILGYLFLGQPEPLTCLEGADVDDNGVLNLSDPIALLSYLYLGGERPRDPFGICGPDPTPDDLGCATPPRC